MTLQADALQLLNISLPYDSSQLNINNAPLLADSKILPRIYVNQVLLDTSKDDVDKLVESNQLDNLGGAYFGASYSYSLRRLKESNALLFYFDVMEMWTDLTSPHLTIIMDKEEQKVLEVVLLQRPLLSAGDHASAYEIIRASLIPRKDIKKPMKMHMWLFLQSWRCSSLCVCLSSLGVDCIKTTTNRRSMANAKVVEGMI